jgi:hydroxymethylbilane synthase
VTHPLLIGSRGSKLALVQSSWVRDRLRELEPGLQVEIEVVQTTGDKLLDTPLTKIGDKGLFVKELETALLEGRIDLAVHSAKDMPTETAEGLAIGAFTAREDVHDVFVTTGGRRFGGIADLPDGAQVGTSSLRRRSQLLALRPDVRVVDIRGNVETRVRKVVDQHLAGTVLAAAGLARLGKVELAAFAFSFDEMLPAVGQGALAVERRAGDERVGALVAGLNHVPTALAVRAERALMSALQGGCQVPVAALAVHEGEELRLRAFVGSLDGRTWVRDELCGRAYQAQAVGRRLAQLLLEAGADEILASVRADG